MVRVGRYGPYLQRALPGEEPADDDRAAIPDGIAPDELTTDKVEELFLGGNGERKLGEHPDTGEPIVVRSGRYGPYVSSGERNASLLRAHSPDSLTLEDALKLLSLPRLLGRDASGAEVFAGAGRYGPYVSSGERNASLLRSQSPDDLTLADALKLLSLPRLLGRDGSGAEIFAGAGRYGPYVKRGDDFRSLDSEDRLFTVSLAEALELLAAPKTRQRRAAAPPLRDMGTDPLTDKPLVIKDGRFGPYVTDGEVNASLRRGQTPETLSIEQASEMLAEKRAKGPAAPRKKATKKAAPAAEKKATAVAAKKTTAAAAKKTTAKKTTAKKATAKKTTAKKAAPKKATARKSTGS